MCTEMRELCGPDLWGGYVNRDWGAVWTELGGCVHQTPDPNYLEQWCEQHHRLTSEL